MPWYTSYPRMLLGATAVAVPLTATAFSKSEKPVHKPHKMDLQDKIRKAQEMIETTMAIQGIPGLSVAVSIDGKMIWRSGFGYANLESSAKCTPDSVMRIASISKPICATLAAQLVETGKLDLDADIRNYLSEFPAKKWEDKDVTITMRQLLSHSAGIRHYANPKKKSDSLEDPSNNNTEVPEFLSNKSYATSLDALEIFKNDDLLQKPGSKFSYTTFGLTLAGAVLEKCSGKSYRQMATQLFSDLGMRNTQLDCKEKIVSGRVSYYQRNSKNMLENCPEVDCSNKYAGGGIISNVTDLLIFANAILHSYRMETKENLIKRDTIRKFINEEVKVDSKTSTGLGWFLVDGKDVKSIDGNVANSPFFYHTGAAVGASSVLLIKPGTSEGSGVCVAILCNLQNTSVFNLGRDIGDLFYNSM
ncbi:CBN-LACT-9 protein [Caenorhabditis brenneri]|uniref:CBN-LACT-9 protein n=1 Tax=Caenorhabditis brenneri TaxID=135651 RepID=G0N6B8_CAEBE|nr:CBN-LACT-9 protein [Caenorhabditis brenneri]